MTLHDNQINYLSHNTFSKLSNLDGLDLRANKCVDRYWERNAFQYMDNIRANLKMCSSNYYIKDISSIVDRIYDNLDKHSTKIENLESQIKNLTIIQSVLNGKMSNFIENMNAKVENLEKTMNHMNIEEKISKMDLKMNDLILYMHYPDKH